MKLYKYYIPIIKEAIRNPLDKHFTCHRLARAVISRRPKANYRELLQHYYEFTCSQHGGDTPIWWSSTGHHTELRQANLEAFLIYVQKELSK